ncbi:L,D-transpeptidase family protein [Enterococcus rivorum]|nr:L,D-transpeptidase family protein [Enterococcus rivorum]MBP2098260.1 vancomycin resistance protein YoaR [Enterococcus rivorum]
MNNEKKEVTSRTRLDNSEKGTTSRKKPTKKKKLLMPLMGALLLLSIVAVGAYLFFQSHFFVTAKANDVSISMLNAKAAKEKLEKLNKTEVVVIKVGDKEEQIELPKKYDITEKYLEENIGKQTIDLPLNKEFQTDLTNKLNALAFEEGIPSQDARIERVDGGFQIAPEQYGTVVDKEALIKQVIADTGKGKGSYTYDVKDFYQKPALTKNDQGLNGQLATLNKKVNKAITLDVNGEKVEFPKAEIQGVLKDDGTIDEAKVDAWVAQMSQQYGASSKPVIFKNIHGVTKKYKNNGSYGWGVDSAKTKAALVQALNSENDTEAVAVPITGDPAQSSTISKDYVEVDMDNQMMYFFKNGEKVVETAIITGRYAKNTATIPGFHTILYKATDTSLSGTMPDGSPYSVPVKFWMPLLSYGGVVTQIGIHDSDYKLEQFGNKEAYKTNFGSLGCINTPGEAMSKIFSGSYDGMPVIIYGNIYDNAPGEFDKPIDYGEPV